MKGFSVLLFCVLPCDLCSGMADVHVAGMQHVVTHTDMMFAPVLDDVSSKCDQRVHALNSMKYAT